MKLTNSHIHPPPFIHHATRSAVAKILVFSAAAQATPRTLELGGGGTHRWPVTGGPDAAPAKSPASRTQKQRPSDSCSLHHPALQSTQSLQSLTRSIRQPHCVWGGRGGCRRGRGRSWDSPSSSLVSARCLFTGIGNIQ